MDEALRNEVLDVYQRLMNQGRCALEIKQFAAGVLELAERDEVFDIKIETKTTKMTVRSHMLRFPCPGCDDISLGTWDSGKFHCQKCGTVFDDIPMTQQDMFTAVLQ